MYLLLISCVTFHAVAAVRVHRWFNVCHYPPRLPSWSAYDISTTVISPEVWAPYQMLQGGLCVSTNTDLIILHCKHICRTYVCKQRRQSLPKSISQNTGSIWRRPVVLYNSGQVRFGYHIRPQLPILSCEHHSIVDSDTV